MNEKGLVKCNTDVVRTRRFELVDDENHMRAHAHVMNGNAKIALSMRGGNRRVKIAAAERGGCEIPLASDDQASRSGIAVDKGGVALISTLDIDGRECYRVEADRFGKVTRQP